ncbi:Double-GTPase 2 domain-containing protein [Tumidithrix helvetica PCC 7403]|uniref:TRAFAC clade GTPase domain-containing protein n=1 Tax=Tumidithrix helvetica TaxID=3457545 RepID=UPI003C9C05BF
MMDISDELNIIMVAPRGVGKTSILAAMHEEFDKTFSSAGLETWTTDSRTLDAVEHCKETLRFIDPRLKDKKVIPTSPQEDPWNDEGFLFEVGNGNKKFMQIRFTDPSGEYFKPTASTSQKDYVKSQLKKCDAIVIPIDSSALMEGKTGRVKNSEIGFCHVEKNDPARITKLFKDAYTEVQTPRLVILAPVKCETYMRTTQDAQSLLDHVRVGYQELLDFLKCEGLYNRVAVVVSPVQTIGNAIFAYHEPDPENSGLTNFAFHKMPINAPYDPKDGDQPLRYILRFLFNLRSKAKKEYLANLQKKVTDLESKLDSQGNKLSSAQKEYEEAKRLLRDRNEVWLPFRWALNWFDDRETPFQETQAEVQAVESILQDTKRSTSKAKNEVQATEEEIKAFNDAIYKFAMKCKEDQGFAILQGKNNWLPILTQGSLL